MPKLQFAVCWVGGDWLRIICRVLFVAAGAGDEFADGFLRTLVVVKDRVHLFRDGHFDGVARGEAECGGGTANAFGYFAVESGDDVGQLAATAEFDADGAVSGQGTGAGEDEIAEA